MSYRHKQLLHTLIFGFLLIALAACGNSEPSSASDSPTASVSASASASETATPSASVEASAEPSEAEEESESPSPSASESESESHEHESVEPSDDTPSSKPIASESASPSASPAPSVSEASESPSKEPVKEDKEVVIEIKDFAFSPAEVTIRNGTTVTFINRDKVKHTATADGEEFDTGLFGKDVSKEVKFDESGTFTYYCAPHPGMTGTIIVEDK